MTKFEKEARVLDLLAQASSDIAQAHLVTISSRRLAECQCGWNLTAANEEVVEAEAKFHSLLGAAKDLVNA